MTRRSMVLSLSALLLAPVHAISASDPPSKVTAPNGAEGDRFGSAVAISGDTMVVGSPLEQARGAAYVFVRSGSWWTEQARLTAEDGAPWDAFGRAVAICGDTIVVGAPGDDGALPDHGSAYVFVRRGTSWSFDTKVLSTNVTYPSGRFGRAVAIDAGTIVVGSADVTDDGAAPGAAHIFVRRGTSWSLDARVVDRDGDDEGFGSAVAIDGSTVVVGAHGDRAPHAQADGAGAAYVITRSVATWSRQARLTAPDGRDGDGLGWSVAIDGDVVALGAPNDDGAGSVRVFNRTGTVWSHAAALVPSETTPGMRFGHAVAVDGGTIVAGSPSGSADGSTYGGVVFGFAGAGGSWTQGATLGAPDASDGDAFGDAVAIDGSAVSVGAPSEDERGPDAGAVYAMIVDTAGPVATIDGAPAVVVAPGGALTGTATDVSAVAEVRVTLQGASGPRTLTAACTRGCGSASISWRIDGASIGTGAYVATVTATDAHGNVATGDPAVVVAA